MDRDHARGVWGHLPADTSVVVAPGVDDASLPGLCLPPTAPVAHLTDGLRLAAGESVVLVVRDLGSLRRALPALRDLGPARRVACLFTAGVATLPTVVERPEWPSLRSFTAARAPRCHAVAEFEDPVDAGAVLVEMARTGGRERLLAPGWPTLGLPADRPELWPPGDPLALPERAAADLPVPPDAFLSDGSLARPTDPVLGRPPAQPPLEHWTGLGPVDECTVNPIGFRRTATGAPVALGRDTDGRLRIGASALDPRTGIGDGDAAALRELAGARVDWPADRDEGFCRAVAGLAASGVPLLSGAVPEWARALLHPELVAALAGDADLEERLDREVHSIGLRRAGLGHHASRPWRAAVARQAGLQVPPVPTTSVVLATRRPEQLGFALRQVARQRGAALELVLVAHGFAPAAAELDAFRRTTDLPLTVLEVPSEVPFGAALNRAVARAAGDVVLKMDDDDWYGRDFVADLLLARGYSAAEVVGCPPEFTFLEPLWLTTRRPEATEQYGAIVAGGTMMVDRSVLRAIGGFRETTRFVDAFVFEAVRAGGGRVYRTHGHGYVLRRGAGGHTWDPGLGYFVSRSRTWNQWHGFRPSPLMDVDAEDLPTRPREGAR